MYLLVVNGNIENYFKKYYLENITISSFIEISLFKNIFFYQNKDY